MRRSIGAALIQFLRRIPARLYGRYRPELHYMRGPGPKSNARKRKLAVDGNGMAASLGNGGKMSD